MRYPRNRELEVDILMNLHLNPDGLSAKELAELLESKYIHKYKSRRTFRNTIIGKLKWFQRRNSVSRIGRRYSHNQTWKIAALGEFYLESSIAQKRVKEALAQSQIPHG